MDVDSLIGQWRSYAKANHVESERQRAKSDQSEWSCASLAGGAVRRRRAAGQASSARTRPRPRLAGVRTASASHVTGSATSLRWGCDDNAVAPAVLGATQRFIRQQEKVLKIGAYGE